MTIAVFDSGMGGLTVLRALVEALPRRDFIYLGDTARLPYGTKSRETVSRYARRATEFLLQHEPENIIIACNTATCAALDDVRAAWPQRVFHGVIEPGAKTAVAATRNKRILVLATEGTVNSNAYPDAIAALDPAVAVAQIACPLFVALAEAGWCDGPEVEAVIRRSLADYLALSDAQKPDTVILGCTHFPALRGALQNVIGAQARLVDSASSLAAQVSGGPARSGSGRIRYYVTDSPERFARIGSVFLGRPVATDQVELAAL